MYIPDENWDQIVISAIELLELANVNDNSLLTGYLNTIINIEDSPLPPQKRKKISSYHKIQKGRKLMRKFTKYYFLRLVRNKLREIK